MPQPRVASEIDYIADYLDEQFTAIRYAAYGLSDEQARATPCTSSLSIGGLIKHVLWVMTENAARGDNPSGEVSADEFHANAGDFLRQFCPGRRGRLRKHGLAVRTHAGVAGRADPRARPDGATAIELVFGIEGREGNDYVTPWHPPDS